VRAARAASAVLRPILPFGQFARFLVVGAGNTLLSFGVFYALADLGAPYAAAAPAAFCAGAANGYVWNRRWTFRARDSLRARLVYVVVQALGAGSTSLLVLILRHLGVAEGRVVTYLGAVAPVTVCLFVANRRLTFSEPL